MSSPPWPGVSLVLLNWNGRQLMEACLPSVMEAAARYPGPAEVVVADNGSTDDSRAWLTTHYPQVRLVALDQNYGFQIGCNRGIAASAHNLIVLLNNDVAVAPDFVAPLVQVLLDKPEAFAVAPRMYYWDREHVYCSAIRGEMRWGRFFQHWALVGDLQDACPGLAPSLYLSGGAMAFRRERFTALGQFDLLYRPYYWEDTDLCYRAWTRGWTLWYQPASVVYHKVSASMQANKFSQHLFLQRNYYLFVWRNFTDPVWLAQHAALLPLNLVASSFKAAQVHQVPWWRALAVEARALWSALRALPEVWRRRQADRAERQISDREVLRRADWRGAGEAPPA